MPLNLNQAMTPDELAAMHRSWLAWSATNIVFTPEGKLVLGVRTAKPESIPEPGDYALIGGFNTLIAPPAMWADVADAHAKSQIGVVLQAEQSSDFLPCEYDMTEIKEPLKTPNGEIPIKRVAYDRVVLLTQEQVVAMRQHFKLMTDHARAKSKLIGIQEVSWLQFERLVEGGGLSFPYQIEHVRKAFDLRVHEQGVPHGEAWTYGDEQRLSPEEARLLNVVRQTGALEPILRTIEALYRRSEETPER